ncbi:uncharacterized protein LOC112499941 [Cynara cardunculus var. scolymus]|uniref:uncharacterized protein LOC112499941 n=1 Tax=Cynara cardunculus var. scolymus TaxID=59895 RepID=UPI000D63098D|nr:uncharacterized protein LOC112499941 [Cynara cardunculus var. scolymus]
MQQLILHRRESGLNEEDKKNRALELYNSLEGGKFNFLHGWVELRDQEKWISQRERPLEVVDLVEDRGSKRTKNDGSGQYTSSSSNTNTSTPELTSTARPMGRKASKDKGKQKSISTNSIDRIEEAMKEQFNLDAEKIEAMNKYTEAIKERERKKEEREKMKDQLKKEELAIRLMEMDPSTMTD